MAHLLTTAEGEPQYEVALADRAFDPHVRERFGDRCRTVDRDDVDSFARLIEGHDVVVNALPFHFGGDDRARGGGPRPLLRPHRGPRRGTRDPRRSPRARPRPSCRSAAWRPGFISIAGYALSRGFDTLERLHMRVGALPQYPTNALKYNLTWSVDGLINEYVHPCEAIVDGARIEQPPLEGYESFALDGVNYEAFNTSGGLGTLAETLAGQVQYLDYKTIRYPGHRDIAKLMLQDFGLAGKREVMKDILRTAIPTTEQDVVVVFVTASGLRKGVRTQVSFARKVYAQTWAGMPMTAIQITTASGVCAVARPVRPGRAAEEGLHPPGAGAARPASSRTDSAAPTKRPRRDERRGAGLQDPGPGQSRGPLRLAAAGATSSRMRILVAGACLLSLAGALVSAQAPAASPERDFLTRPRRLTVEGRRAGEGYWSKDGKKLVFQSEREPGNPFYQIYTMDMATGDVARVSPGMGKTTCSFFNPETGDILFASTHHDPRSKQLQDEELTFRASGQERRYSWDYDPEMDLYVRNAKTGTYTRLTSARGYDAEASYSPDGQWIAFSSTRQAYDRELSAAERKQLETDPSFFAEIYIMRADADGSGVKRLTNVTGYDGGPFFSPDGKRIIWRRFDEQGLIADIWTMNLDGTDQRQITSFGAMSWAPYIHPSGAVRRSSRRTSSGSRTSKLFMVDIDGRKQPVRVTYSDGFDGLPVPSPDGTQLAWTSSRGGGREGQIFLAQWNHEPRSRRCAPRPRGSRMRSIRPPPARRHAVVPAMRARPDASRSTGGRVLDPAVHAPDPGAAHAAVRRDAGLRTARRPRGRLARRARRRRLPGRRSCAARRATAARPQRHVPAVRVHGRQPRRRLARGGRPPAPGGAEAFSTAQGRAGALVLGRRRGERRRWSSPATASSSPSRRASATTASPRST